MGREFCDTIKYRGKEYIVHWDSSTYLVYVSKVDNPLIENINYDYHRAESKEEAPKAAKQMLIAALGKDFG